MPRKTRVLVIDDIWGRADDNAITGLYGMLDVDFLLESSQATTGDFIASVSIERILREMKRSLDVVLLDIMFEDVALGLEILERARQESPILPILMLTTLESARHRETVIDCMALGANEYIEKAPDAEKLMAILDVYTNPESDLALYGNSKRMRELRAQIARVAFSDSTSVLIVGDSGTGKELIAKAIHRQGLRRYGAFIAKNCAHCDSQLLDSELFGHEKGAFTGATERQVGLIEEANKGVLFLDEIADMPAQLQAKLLRVLETRTFRRVGGREDLKSDFQLICATNRDPAELMRDGKLRQDLYYRVSTMTLHAPALREHLDDIPAYVDLFIRKFKARGGASYSGETFSQPALDLLCRHSWPGNVRELRNVVERAIILSRNALIAPDDLPPEMLGTSIALPLLAVDPATERFAAMESLSSDDAVWPKQRLIAEIRLAVEAKRCIQAYKGAQWKAEFMRLMYPECKAANAKGFDDLVRRLTKGPWGASWWKNDDDIKRGLEELMS